MVLEKILYSEVFALEHFREYDMEHKITTDITSTLNLFSTIIPQFFSTTYAFIRESQELYRKRKNIDVLAILRPTGVGLASRFADWIKFHMVDKKKKKLGKKSILSISEMFTTVLDGLADLQLNNLQEVQLDKFDAISDKHLLLQEGFTTFVTRMYSNFSSRNIIDFMSEVYITHKVMRRRNINHEKYRKIQIDIDHDL